MIYFICFILYSIQTVNMESEDFANNTLKYSYVRPEEMSEADIEILHSAIARLDLKIESIDPIPVTEHLHRNKLVDKKFYHKMIEMAFTLRVPNRELCEYFIKQIPKTCSLGTLTNALRETGYTNISRMIVEQIILPNSSVHRMCRCDTSNRRNVQQFFKTLKRKVWNADFDNPRERLRTYAIQLSALMKKETNIRKQCAIGDKIGAVLSAEIDAHAITFNAELSEHFLFNELRDLIPKTSNTIVTDVILYGRLANACAIGKHFNMAEKYILKAKSCSAFMTPCLELANMVYCDVYVKLWEFEQNPSEEIRQSLLQMAEVGVQCLREEEEEIRLLWTRMFFLRMVFCILGIGNRATIIPNCIVTESGILTAKEILAVLGQTLDTMDKRRSMFYYIARGRLCDIEGSIALAAKYVRKSFELADQGNFKEKPFICQYMQEIEKRDWKVLDISSTEQNPPSNYYSMQETDNVFHGRTPDIDTEPKEIHIITEEWPVIDLQQAPPLDPRSFDTDSKRREMDESRNPATNCSRSPRRSSWALVERKGEFDVVPMDPRHCLSNHLSGTWSIVDPAPMSPPEPLTQSLVSNLISHNRSRSPVNEVIEVAHVSQLSVEQSPNESCSFFKMKIESLEESINATQDASRSNLNRRQTNEIPVEIHASPNVNGSGEWSMIDLPEGIPLELPSLNSYKASDRRLSSINKTDIIVAQHTIEQSSNEISFPYFEMKAESFEDSQKENC